jgi:hypothetical protein
MRARELLYHANMRAVTDPALVHLVDAAAAILAENVGTPVAAAAAAAGGTEAESMLLAVPPSLVALQARAPLWQALHVAAMVRASAQVAAYAGKPAEPPAATAASEWVAALVRALRVRLRLVAAAVAVHR